MEFHCNEYASLLRDEAIHNECVQSDPHCPKLHGYLCARGCFEITIDLQTMTVIESE